MADATQTAVTAQVAIQRELLIQRYMPDTCQLVPTEGTTPTVVGVGVLEQTAPTAKLWRGLTNIPCRVDLSRAFRPAALKEQTAEVNEFTIEFPYDVPIDEDDKVVIDGDEYEIRRLKDVSVWDVTVEALVMLVSTNLD